MKEGFCGFSWKDASTGKTLTKQVVSESQVAAFHEEMRKAGVDRQMVIYGGAVHSFTNPEADTDNSKGAAYNEKADKRSWEAMKQFFAEIF